jgi:bifunctional DNase/RNase
LLSTKDEKVMLPILVDEATALVAAFRLAGQSAPVPFSQDLSAVLVRQLGAQVTEVWIDGVRQTEAQGRILLRQGQRALSVPSLPADAVLLALEQRARIFAPPRLLKDAGIRLEDLNRVGRDARKKDEGVGGSGEVDTL